MKKRIFIYMAFLLLMSTVQLCYAEDNNQVSRVIVDLTDKRHEVFEIHESEAFFYHCDKRQGSLPKTNEEKKAWIPLLGLIICLLTILFKIKKDIV